MLLEKPVPTMETPDGTAYTVHGDGEPLVLIHGVGMQQDVWRPQVEALAATHQVIVYDMLGHGGSRLPLPGEGLDAYAAQLARLLDHLGLPAANVAGHSMGALVALEFALSYPARTLRVAALNAVFERSSEQSAAVLARAAELRQQGAAATIAPTIRRWFGDPVESGMEGVAAEVSGYLEHVQPEGYAHTYQLFAASDRVHADRLSSLRVPALFFTGEHDGNSNPGMSAAMAQRVAGAVCEVIPDARHMMTVTHPGRVNQVLLAWLAMPAHAAHRSPSP